MYTVIVVMHLIVCLFLIFIILIQSSKGAEMGAAFGGSSQTLFGSRGAATFLNKLTTIAAIAFMLTSLSLAVLSIKRGSIMPETIPAQESPIKPFSDTTSGPLQEPSAEGTKQSVPVQNAPLLPAQPGD
ncbi:MAG: preprotein translocase subunit SecG [Thermodesulfovibrionia bacterium]|nr:preprotein translocase subunit SecG [Thermodesulfovibrionia bacterium]